MDSVHDSTIGMCKEIINNVGILDSRIKYLELPTACPFFFAFDCLIECPYLNKDNICKSIKVAPGNSAAWCYKMVELGVKDSSKPWKREV